MTIIAATGHRPPKLAPWADDPYSREVEDDLRSLARGYLTIERPDQGISGMALGWDQAFAWACVDLGIPFIAAVPCSDYEMTWPEASRIRYRDLISRASEVVIVFPGPYFRFKLEVRNEWMVDNSDKLVALWDGSSSGTKNCLLYSKRRQKPFDNLWPTWRLWSSADLNELCHGEGHRSRP